MIDINSPEKYRFESSETSVVTNITNHGDLLHVEYTDIKKGIAKCSLYVNLDGTCLENHIYGKSMDRMVEK